MTSTPLDQAEASLAIVTILSAELELNLTLPIVCSKYYTMNFGDYIRQNREQLREKDSSYSLRQVAERAGIQPTYLSKLERGELDPPSEATARRLATELRLDPDVVLALAGKVSSDLQDIIRRRPMLFADLIRQLKETPDHAILKLVREVRDGEW